MSDFYFFYRAHLYVVQEEHSRFLVAFGQRVAELRVKQGLTKVQLAFEMNTGEKYIRRLEKGEINITMVNLLKLATVLNVSVQELIAVPQA